MKKKLILLLVIFSISIIITYPAFPPSHALDSYCTMCKGYIKTGTWFLQNGRIFSYLLLMFANSIKLSFNALGFVSVLFGNFFISIAIITLYNELKSKLNFKDYLYNYLLLGLVFLLFYSPLYTSILVFDEVMIMDLGILFLTLASIILLKGGKKNYFISLILTILGITCYQGIASYLFVILFILIIANKDNFDNIKNYIIKIILSIINYGIAFVSNLCFIKIFNKVSNKSNIKVGTFNIIDNLNKIITKLIPNSFRYFFGFLNPKHYYLFIAILTIITIIYIFKNQNKTKSIILFLLLIAACLLTPFIPNIFMSATSNYTDARMTLTIGIIPSIIILFIIMSFKIDKKYFYIFSIFCLIIFLTTFRYIRGNMLIDLKRYKNDIKYVNNLMAEIDKYEKEYEIDVDTIYYHNDIDSAFYYDFGHNNGINIRLMAVPWAFDCAFNAVSNNKFTFKKMTEDKYNSLYQDEDYDAFSSKQLVFEDNTLYLLIY